VSSSPAKILLFGEYTVINGSKALAIPFDRFQGEWVDRAAPAFDWNPLLRFLVAHPELEIDHERLASDLARGGGFLSTIPQGKGLGSSGALVAALLKKYGPPNTDEWSLNEVQKRLALLEGYYHGQSSGVDPLVSWVRTPLLIAERGPELVTWPVQSWAKLERFFLFDSQVARHSAPLVAVFKQKCLDPLFAGHMEHLTLLIDEALDCYEEVNELLLGHVMRSLSELQLRAFKEMIPPPVAELWQQGLASGDFALKLCGAGGGGYFIGYRLRNAPSGVLKF